VRARFAFEFFGQSRLRLVRVESNDLVVDANKGNDAALDQLTDRPVFERQMLAQLFAG
jgi:hypothetical protein